jgi:hypothetical protein
LLPAFPSITPRVGNLELWIGNLFLRDQESLVFFFVAILAEDYFIVAASLTGEQKSLCLWIMVALKFIHILLGSYISKWI